ncbi:flagellar biosynthesis anti-sigma factor FlgM [Glaciecola sp. MH2013]|uniref:flagellar biosynthesis anti-sigma factor FlgM n=1 Tax=Glaciecola sp. MH2013 TaxID=2785524 RepID=UPI00189EBC51|nr:flagellar biosynthesis anti-sigma factor FlgM [Glaciecola sp. MH2013]MBF7072321.1 flagellar biosynthesis anti-sigma factor FlgM [Glaciecola sp. MH2013]
MTINNVNNNINKPQIDGQKLAQQQNAGQQAATANASQNTAAAASAPRTDSVSLTQSAQQLSQVQKKGSEAPVNQEKVDKLKKAIADGEYKINPEVLAQKIAKLETQIFGSGA